METYATFFRITIIWCLLVSLTITNGARILGIFPMPGQSHFSQNEAMMRSLHNAGHEITFASPFFDDKSLKNYSIINTKRDLPIFIGVSTISSFRDLSFFESISVFIEMDTELCRDVLSSPEIQNLMKSPEKHYDVMFVELLYTFQCYLPLAEKLNIPVIGTITMRSWMFAETTIGNPFNPAVIPIILTSFSDKMSFLERLQNVCKDLYLQYIYYFNVQKRLSKIYDKFYTPDLLNKKQISLTFLNSHFSFLPRPASPNVIDVGGIVVKPAKSLPKSYQKFIDEAEHGVILFSLGSVGRSSSLNADSILAFRDAFAEIPQRVIWKFEEQIVNLPKNILLSKWIPQRDILAHKNVKAFISHCGISGSYEGLSEGIPMIFTPLFGDQMSNAALLERLGVGISLDIFSATKEKVLTALNTIINDTRYRDKMKEVSERFKDRPMSPQESMVYWTEYVIRHNGAPHMRPTGSDLPFYQYFLLDIIAVIIITTAFSCYIVAKIIKKCHHLFFKTTKYNLSIFIKKKQS